MAKNKVNQIAYTYFISFATTGVSSETRIQDVVVYITKYLNPTKKVYGYLSQKQFQSYCIGSSHLGELIAVGFLLT